MQGESVDKTIFLINREYFDNGVILRNPKMGNIIYYYANSVKYYKADIDTYEDEYLNSMRWASVMYFRLPWSFFEAEDGKYDWSIIDDAINRYKKYGFRFAIRVTTSEIDKVIPFATPRWVYERGAKYNRFTATYPGRFDENGSNYEPVFGDRIFLFYLDRFLKNFSEKYDGHNLIDFIDIGSLGVYGEGHTVSSTQIGYDSSVLLHHIDMHIKYFKKTKLMANHNYADHDPKNGRNMAVMNIIADYNIGFRDDSILMGRGTRAFYDQKIGRLFSKNNPVALEMGEYSTRVKSEMWNEQKIIDAIKSYRASYFGIYWYPRKFYEKEGALVNLICKTIGYRLIVKSVSVCRSRDVITHTAFIFVIKNVGVAPIYENLKLKIYSGTGDANNIVGESEIFAIDILPEKDFSIKIECKISYLCINDSILMFGIFNNKNEILYLPHDKSNVNGLVII
jgi:hypothetical protein